jgi:MFS family permease
VTVQHPIVPGPSALLGLVWIAVWGFSGFFLSYSTMVPLALAGGLSPVTGGALLAVMMLSVIAIQPAAPALQQRWGPRGAIGRALLLMAAGHGSALAPGHPVASLLVTGLAVGCGFGLLVVVATAAVPRAAPPDQAGRALGQFGAATSAAAAVGAPLGLWLSGVLPPEAFRLVAVAAVLLAFLTLSRIPARPTPAAVAVHVPPAAEGPAAETPVTEAPAAPTAAAGHPGETRASGESRSAMAPVLLPFLVSMAAYGLVIAFGPGGDTAHPALFIAIMQGASVLGRWAAGTLTDRHRPVAVYTVGIAMTALGLALVSVVSPGWPLVGCLLLMGVGVGTVQSASLVMAFARAGSGGRASVGWNMSFDTGLGLAGVVGGLGFAHLGETATYASLAGLLLVAALPLWLRRRR